MQDEKSWEGKAGERGGAREALAYLTLPLILALRRVDEKEKDERKETWRPFRKPL